VVEKKKEAGREMTVLLAEDNAISRRYLRDHLETLGYEVVGAASNGEEAIELAREKTPALIILDFKMPKMNGIEAARKISSEIEAPIILITGHSTEEVAADAIEAGVFAYLIKPVTRKHLLPAIKLALTRFEQFKSLQKEVGELHDAIETRKLIERAKGILMKRCNIGEEEAFKLLQTHSQKENKKMRDIAHTVIEASKLI
jgi:response regulator NasT